MCLLVYLTLPARENAREFCRQLVEHGLAAGMNILSSCHSVYYWEGETREAGEWVIIAQVARNNFEKFCAAAREIHPYSVPCIVGWAIERGHGPFLDWIRESSQR